MSIPVPPPDSHFISLEKFLEMKKTYQDNQDLILAPFYRGKEILCTSETFNVEAFKVVQSAQACAGIKIYYGMSADLKIHAMIIAVDENGNEILPAANATFATRALATSPAIVEDSQRCPPRCS